MTTTLAKPYFVWLGAGEAADAQLLEQFLKQYPQGKITLVEARDNAVVKLQQRYADAPNYSIDSAVLAIQAGKSTFYTLNLPEFSSLQQPAGLVSLFPGVAVQKMEPVDTLAVDQYIARLSIEAEQPNHLHIDIPAQAGNIVRQLIKHEQLHFFSELHITAGLEALYEQAEKQADIEIFLVRQGYEVVSIDNTDPDIPVVSFKLNSSWVALCKLQEQMSAALKANDNLSEQVSEIASKVSYKEAEIESLKSLNVDLTMELSVQRDLVSKIKRQFEAESRKAATLKVGLESANKSATVLNSKLVSEAKKNEKITELLEIKQKKLEEEQVEVISIKEKIHVLEAEKNKNESEIKLLTETIREEKEVADQLSLNNVDLSMKYDGEKLRNDKFELELVGLKRKIEFINNFLNDKS